MRKIPAALVLSFALAAVIANHADAADTWSIKCFDQAGDTMAVKAISAGGLTYDVKAIEVADADHLDVKAVEPNSGDFNDVAAFELDNTK